MAPIKFGVEVIRSFLKKHKIATLAELKQALGTLATMTVFRKLKALGYLTSLSHRGKYYTLVDIPRFDELGLWSHQSVWFSRDGTLVATAQRLVEEASAGLTATELHAFLPVEVKEALLRLYRQERIDREEIGGGYVYFSRDSGIRRNQKMRRLERPAAWELGESLIGEDLPPELKAAMILFFSLLDERQRRLYAGLEAHKLGYGGDRKVAQFLGVDEHTVARGRQELFSDQVRRERIRNEGGGRKAVEKKRPQ
jgi:hypothetical protein